MARTGFLQGREKLEKFLVYVLPVITAITLLLAKLVEVVELWLAPQSKSVFLSIVRVISEIAVTLLCTEILLYLVLERSGLLVNMDKRLDEATNEVGKIMATSSKTEQDVVQLTTRDQMQAMLQEEAEALYRKIILPQEVTNLPAAEQAYTRAIETINKVNANVKGRQKRLTFCALYPGGTQLPPKTSSSDKAYFDEFDNVMKQCIASEGKERWNVRVLYNVTTQRRLEMVVGLLSLGTEGYEVKAICWPSAISRLSPMVVDEQDAFLATVNKMNFRVDAAIHLRGQQGVAFVERFADSLWDSDTYHLRREETGIDNAEITRLREAVIRIEGREAS